MANVRIKDLTTTAATTASDDFFGVDGATNDTRKLNAYSPTFGGNLTVSGTGQSSVGGYLSINSALAGSTYGRLISGTTTAGLPAFFATNAVDASLVVDFPSATVARVRTNSASEIMAFAIGTTERARFETTGNLIIGSPFTDGGQKLQVNGTFAWAGNATQTSQGTLLFANGGVISAASGGSLTLSNNGGSIYIYSPNFNSGGFVVTNGNGTWNNGSKIILNDTTASTSTSTGALVVSGGVGVAGAVNVGGAIAIGNTVAAAVGVASTHKVTISIGGSTYYLLATNV